MTFTAAIRYNKTNRFAKTGDFDLLVIEALGNIAGALVTFSMIPQLLQVYKLKSAREISLAFNLMLLSGIICWLAYGIYLGLIPVIVWNAVGATLVTTLLLTKIKYGR